MQRQTRQSFAAARASLPAGQWHRLLAKTAFAGLIAIAFLWLLANRLADIPLHEASGHLFTVTSSQWLTAVVATAASIWAAGRYDGVIHRYLATGVHASDACRAGATAIAVSQTIGLGVVTGSILRWRMLPNQSLWQATKLTGLVTLFFLLGWAIFTACILVILPGAPFKPVAACVVMVGIVGIGTCAAAPPWRTVRWPNLFVILRLLGLTALDTLAAAFALWVLCPAELALPFATLLPVFLLALGAGLMSGAPGGIGAFELTLLALLPALPEGPLLAAVLTWRMVYFAVPAVIGAAFAIKGPKKRPLPPTFVAPAALTKTASRAETGLLAQGHLSLISAGYDQAWLSGRTPHCLIALFDPLAQDPQTGAAICDQRLAIIALIDAANSESRLPVLYKCSARTAAIARSLGLLLRPIAREAWLNPRCFDLNTPSRAGLRRKLRRASTAGIRVTTGAQDWTALERIATEWAVLHGGERGFSMGRFDPHYLKNQRIYVASVDGNPVAFASFHAGKYEWTLDLMRHSALSPDGTMHALIATAIADAAAQDLPRLSLAAVPMAALTQTPRGYFAAWGHRVLGGKDAGLAQFKSAFVPQWQTLYLAAPHRLGLVLSGAEIAREVLAPAALVNSAHHVHAQYGFATAR